MLHPPAILLMYVALLISLFAVYRQHQARYFWLIQAVLLGAAWLGGMFYQQRMLNFAALFALIPLVWAMRHYWLWCERQFYKATNLVIGISLFLFCGLIGILCFTPETAIAAKSFCPPREQRPRCDLKLTIPTLNDPAKLGQTPLRIMASMNDGAALLLHTIPSGHFVLAAPYHTVVNGNRAVRETLMASTNEAAIMVRTHGIDLILLCKEPLWQYLKSQSAVDICHLQDEHSLLGDLLSGHIPPWLTEISLPTTSHYKLFQAHKSLPLPQH
jgi:hypothetical protein